MSLTGTEQELCCSSETERQEEGRSLALGAQNMGLLWDRQSHWSTGLTPGLTFKKMM